METFEEHIQKAINQGVVGNAVLEARHKGTHKLLYPTFQLLTLADPSYQYKKAFGKLTLESTSAEVRSDAVYWIASCTKLLTSISALQCVQRGLVTLDEPVSRLLPELASPDIITGFDASTNKPILIKAKNPITLRQLLTHTSGMAYPFSSPLVAEWRAQNPIGNAKWDVLNEFLLPLTFEPGAPGKWQYSVSLDWAGKLVERLNGGGKLGEYMQENIFKPLGIKDTTFRPLQRKDLMDRMTPRLERLGDGGLKMHNMELYPIIEPIDDCGGGGLYSNAEDYIKILESLLRDDGKLLNSSSLDQLFQPQLPENEELTKTLNRTGPGSVMNGYGETEVKLNHGLGGLVAVDEVPGSVGKGMLCWDGLPSCFWWVDREKGICGFYGSQIVPGGDRKSAELFGEFRKAVYSAA